MSRKEYRGIKEEIGKRAGEASGPEKHAIKAIAHQVDAFNVLDDRMEELQGDIRNLNRSTSRLMKAQIVLILVQVLLGVIALSITLILAN